ncbi:MAG: ATP-binding cassette domain-containing protein, partial [Eubacteriales bacterium]|nr:ATP-binding cassette domain-containing protein [Eubacteriales bacterium]
MNEILFETHGLGKTYGSNNVLRNIDMALHSGEVVGLIGENGAGKSTLMKLICGVERPTAGTMMLRGNPYQCGTILEANRMGIGMVFQEQSMVGALTVAQNIFLGREKSYSKYGLIDWTRMNRDARKALQEIDVNDIDPGKKAADLDFA